MHLYIRAGFRYKYEAKSNRREGRLYEFAGGWVDGTGPSFS